jgi:hypothetical protein
MKALRGMSLIDVVVGTALLLIVFLALFGLLQASVLVSSFVKSEATATAIANSQMEYIRSLPYNSVGTVGGIPAGVIPQNATTTEDSESYGVRTFIDYYDDPADGLGANDTNGITTDYKRIKVVVSYMAGSHFRQITLLSNYAPPGIETTLGGGTLQILVVNATGAPVPGATVTITNASTSPTVNLTTFSDANGSVYLPGAATSTQYAVTVTKNGYSTAQTYARNSNNQNPTPGYLTVVQNTTTSATFAIDQLSTLTLSTFSPITGGAFSDSFANASELVTLTNTAASGGALTLSGGAGNYALSGSAISTTTAPAYLYSWTTASSTMSTPPGTTALVHVLDGSGNLIPDSVLAGNAAGFTSFPINLSGVSTTTYPALALSASLQTTSSSTSPSLSGWIINYQYGPVPLPNVSFTLTGSKTIGTTGAGAPIYKTTVSSTTGSAGVNPLTLEWDSYALSIPSYDVEDACGAPPYALAPGTSVPESLILVPDTTNSLLVTVTDASGNVVPGATVTLSRSGYTKTVTGSGCGAAYFGAITAASDYTVVISKTGYTTTTFTGVTVSGNTFYVAAF